MASCKNDFLGWRMKMCKKIMLFSCSLTSIIQTSALVSFSTGSPETLVTQSWMASVMWGTTTKRKKHLPVVGSYPNSPKRLTYSLEGLKILSLIVSVSRPYLHFELNWVIQENILSIPRTAFQNSKGKGAIFELEIWRHGVFSYRISTGERQECIPWKRLSSLNWWHCWRPQKQDTRQASINQWCFCVHL